MPLLDKKQKEQLEKIFRDLKEEVQIHYFTRAEDCEHCRLGAELIEEVGFLSDKIKVRVIDVSSTPALAAAFGVDKFPATVISAEKDYGLRFFGIPAGHEFTAFIKDIIQVSLRDPQLPPSVQQELSKIKQPVHLQVMTSLSCPYCPLAVLAAHRLALASEFIRADMIDTAEFPAVAEKYNVSGVPHTVINESYHLVGAVPERELVYFIQNAVGVPLSSEGEVALAAFRLQAPSPPEHKHSHPSDS